MVLKLENIRHNVLCAALSIFELNFEVALSRRGQTRSYLPSTPTCALASFHRSASPPCRRRKLQLQGPPFRMLPFSVIPFTKVLLTTIKALLIHWFSLLVWL